MSETSQIKMVQVDDLIPYVNNARKHSEEQVAQIAGAISEFGFISPIITDGANGILAGHGRLMAARKLGMTEVPVLEASHLTPAQRKAYILADNKIGDNSTFDYELLSVELESLREFDFDVNITGFTDFEIMSIESKSSDNEGGEDYGSGSGESGGDYDPEGGESNGYSIQYTIIFDDEEQQAEWHNYIKRLRDSYPTLETISQRIIADLKSHA